VTSKESTDRLPDPPLEQQGRNSQQKPQEEPPVWPADKSISGSMDYDFLWSKNLECKFGECSSCW